MSDNRQQQIRANLNRLAAMHASVVSVLEDSIAILQAEFDALSRPSRGTPKTDQSVASDLPIVDRSVMCVVFRGARCYLGNTLMLKFLERLLRRPNQYISHDDLLREVWNAIREQSSIRSLVKELRAKLRAAGMSLLANAIDGQVSGHYGLMLDRAK